MLSGSLEGLPVSSPPQGKYSLPKAHGWLINLSWVPLWALPYVEESRLTQGHTPFSGYQHLESNDWLTRGNTGRAEPLAPIEDKSAGPSQLQSSCGQLKLSRQLKCNSTSPPAQSCFFHCPEGIDPRIRLHTNLSQSLLPREMTYDTCPKSKS